jgi:hypothetical protein
MFRTYAGYIVALPVVAVLAEYGLAEECLEGAALVGAVQQPRSRQRIFGPLLAHVRAI